MLAAAALAATAALAPVTAPTEIVDAEVVVGARFQGVDARLRRLSMAGVVIGADSPDATATSTERVVHSIDLIRTNDLAEEDDKNRVTICQTPSVIPALVTELVYGNDRQKWNVAEALKDPICHNAINTEARWRA